MPVFFLLSFLSSFILLPLHFLISFPFFEFRFTHNILILRNGKQEAAPTAHLRSDSKAVRKKFK